MIRKNPDNGTVADTELELREVGRDKLSSSDTELLHQLERNNKIDYNESYVSEFLKCRNNV